MKWLRIGSVGLLLSTAVGIILMQRTTLKRLASVDEAVVGLQAFVAQSTRLGWQAAGAVVTSGGCAGAKSLPRDELRALLHEELAARLGDGKSSAPAAADEPPTAATPEAPERIEALHRAELKVEEILHAQVMGDAQLMELQALDAGLPLDQADALNRRLIVAANSGHLRITAQHPIF